MRRTLLFLFTVALTVSFVACNGAKKTEENAPAAETAVEEVATPQEEVALPAVKTPEQALKDFEAYVKEYADAYNNKLSDIRKYQSLAMRSQQEVADMERFKTDFNARQLKRYEIARKNIEKINTGK
jgi:DNA helicase IV